MYMANIIIRGMFRKNNVIKQVRRVRASIVSDKIWKNEFMKHYVSRDKNLIAAQVNELVPFDPMFESTFSCS